MAEERADAVMPQALWLDMSNDPGTAEENAAKLVARDRERAARLYDNIRTQARRPGNDHERIADDNQRSRSYRKRAPGLISKCAQLHDMTGAEIQIIITPADKECPPFMFSTKSSIKACQE